MRIERILAGIDLAPDCGQILAYASFFAKAAGASLHLLSVFDYLVTPPTYLTPYIGEEKRIAEEKFHVWEEKLAAYGVPAVREIMVGRLSESLATAVKRTMADLLVLGFRTHAFRRSSSEGLVKGLQIPVLAVRGERAKSAGIGSLELKKLLCATDFSESSEKALKTAKMLADSFSAKLTVLHVLPSQALEARVDRKNDVDISRQERLTRAKDGLGNFLKNSGVEDSGVIEEGDPRRVISSFSLEYRADLIVVGARGLASLKGLLPIGRVADMVLKSAPCPVLVVH